MTLAGTQPSDSQSITRPKFIKEVARTVLKDHGFTAEDIRNSKERALELQRLIFAAQVSAEEAILSAEEHQSQENGAWFVSDRSGLDPIVYAQMYVCPEAAQSLMSGQRWEGYLAHLKQAKVFICEPGTPWLTDDGTRLMPVDLDEWMLVHSSFCDLLAALNIPYTTVPKELLSLDDRLALILKS